MKLAFTVAVIFVVYCAAFAFSFRHSTLCYMSDDTGSAQPFLAYGFHPNPTVNHCLDALFYPFTVGLNPDDMIPDPSDFSATSGWRLGWSMPILLWNSWIGKLTLLLLIASLASVASVMLPALIRIIKLCLMRMRPAELENVG